MPEVSPSPSSPPSSGIISYHKVSSFFTWCQRYLPPWQEAPSPPQTPHWSSRAEERNCKSQPISWVKNYFGGFLISKNDHGSNILLTDFLLLKMAPGHGSNILLTDIYLQKWSWVKYSLDGFLFLFEWSWVKYSFSDFHIINDNHW